MKTIMSIRTWALISMMALTGTVASAQHRHGNHIYYRGFHRPVVTSIVKRPAVTTHISNRLSKQDKLDMALAYLRNNAALTIQQYSKMTGLTKATAEAELDAFAVSKRTSIKMVTNGKKKYYVLP